MLIYQNLKVQLLSLVTHIVFICYYLVQTVPYIVVELTVEYETNLRINAKRKISIYKQLISQLNEKFKTQATLFTSSVSGIALAQF